MWALNITQAVPIDRVLTNLQQRLAKDTNNVETLYDLARVHSMAYSTNLVTVDVGANQRPDFGRLTYVPRQVVTATNLQTKIIAKQHLTNAIGYYQRAATLVMKGTNISANKWLINPIHLGLAWCLDQDGQRQEAIKAYRNALQTAWELEIERAPLLMKQVDLSWDKIRAQQSPFSKPKASLMPGICFSEEIIGYLLKLLDPVKDAKEIEQLEKDRAMISRMNRAVTPIIVPLEANLPLEKLINPDADVAFDLDGSGFQRHWGWITPKAAWLVFDHDGSGRITSGLQMFGNVTFWIFWRDGYDALSSLDDNGDGRLSGPELNGISLWQDLNGNGIADPGEVRPITDYNVVAIECVSEPHPSGIRFNPRGIVFRDGTSRPTYDWIAPSAGQQITEKRARSFKTDSPESF